MAATVDIAIVSLGTTMGWQHADRSLAEQIEAAGVSCELRPMRLGAARHLQRSMALTDVVQALASCRAAHGVDARAVIYSSFTAALLQPSRHPHAVRFDSIATLNRPGAGGAWQRRRERTVLGRADLLLPMSEAAAAASAKALGEAEVPRQVVLPAPVEIESAPAADAPDAIAYAANPEKRGLDLLCVAWAAAAPVGARLAVGGIDAESAARWLAGKGVEAPPAIEFLGAVPRDRWTALVAGARVYVSAARYEDWGLAQMEALAAGVPLVTAPTAGANVALPLARRLAPELVAADDTPHALAQSLRAGLALEAPARADYARRAAELLEPYSDAALRRLVAEDIVPALLGSSLVTSAAAVRDSVREGAGRVWLEAGLLAAAALPVLLLMDAYVRDSPSPKNDELIYELMAQQPFDPHTFPFAHRIAVPTLVHLLPFDHTFSFSVLAWLSTVACGGLVYVLLRRFEIGKRLAFALGLCIAWCPTLFVVSLREGRNVDPESVLVMLAGTIAIVDRRRVAFAVILLVGAFVREAALFLVPFAYAVWAERPWDPRAAKQTALSTLPALAAYATLRLTIPFVERENVIGYKSLIGGRWEVLRTAFEGTEVLVRRLASAFGPLWLVAPFALRDLSFARRGLVLVGMCCLGMTFALDWGRIVFFALPVVVVSAAWVMRDKPRLAIAVVAAFMAMNFGYVIYMEDFGGAQDGIIDAGPARYLPR